MLDKQSKRVLWIFGIALLAIVISEVTRPRPIDWRASYTSADKIPFGGFVLFQELKSLFKNSEIQKVQTDPYEFLVANPNEQNSIYLFINDAVYFDQNQTAQLLKYVENGNTVFISARNFGAILADSLNVESSTDYNILEKELHPKFFLPSLAKDSLPSFKKGVFKTLFVAIDTLNTTVLGYYKSEKPKLKALNYIKINYGKGTFLLHSLPEAFSNYYLLNGNQQYAANVFSFIDAEKIYWDEHLKSGRKVVTSPIRFILDQAPLTWAYYVLTIGLLVFIFFRGKREQRIVEVVKPLENTSIEFTKTMGDLYFQHKDYSSIIAKKITYFLESLRAKYFLNTNDISEEFIKKVALKSGNTVENTKKLMLLINHLKEKSIHSETDLLQLNKEIEAFRL